MAPPTGTAAAKRRRPSPRRPPPRPSPKGRGGGASDKPVDAKALIPPQLDNLSLDIDGKLVKLTNLKKVYWPDDGYTKGDLLRYYASVSQVLLPHLRGRAMVMKRYPNGINEQFFFMKRVPDYHPPWIELCKIAHTNAGVVPFPIVNDLASLLWVVNLGCIDLNQWYATCDDVHRPDYLHFDLDPVKAERGEKEVPFKRVLETALLVRDGLKGLKISCCAKTTGSRGIHVYVPIVRGPTQKDVWTFAKAFAQTLARSDPKLITAEYKVSKRPAGRVLVDYNQNAWGRTLASVYSLRPRPRAPVSAPVSWKEIERGITIDDFRIDNMAARVRKVGDLFEPLLEPKGRFDLEAVL